ncbi:transposase [Paenarthrobacter ureafaciens]|uniref:Transposase n=1 Tax=Paenarthrobacter ureafaciens TaxID=37931 RepID=A0AAX3EHW0_PAEUR|nr:MULTISPECIES: transposase [Paenarthrobacter]MDO5865859.1 transposase [Paenarthrobacter sp. SD-2]MDO5876953.1 transposase [Paenarthrobacter sp. SD-1]QMU83585.1 transposase [Paenarthrobacter ureafaciens]UYV92163.1 transposase [Paenarthrobacter ureafaciens]UYV96699.1 transposase [Paenarthrobacter ureafaciens]
MRAADTALWVRGRPVEKAERPKGTNCGVRSAGWWREIEVSIVTGATTAKLGANNTAIKYINRTGRGFTNGRNYKTISCCAMPPEQRHE